MSRSELPRAYEIACDWPWKLVVTVDLEGVNYKADGTHLLSMGRKRANITELTVVTGKWRVSCRLRLTVTLMQMAQVMWRYEGCTAVFVCAYPAIFELSKPRIILRHGLDILLA